MLRRNVVCTCAYVAAVFQRAYFCGAHSTYLWSHSTLSLPLWSTQYIPMVSLHPLPPSVEHTVRTYGLTPPSPSLCGAHSTYLWSHSTLSLPLWSAQYVPMVSLHSLPPSVEHTVHTYGLTPPSPSLCGAHSMYLWSHSTLSLPLWSTQYIPMVSLHPLPPSVEHTVCTYGLTPPSFSLCGAHSTYLWSHSTLSLPLWSTQYVPMVSLHPLSSSVEHTVRTYGLTPPSPSLCGAHSTYLWSHSTLSLPLWSTQYVPMVSLHPLSSSVGWRKGW